MRTDATAVVIDGAARLRARVSTKMVRFSADIFQCRDKLSTYDGVTEKPYSVDEAGG